MKVAGELDYLVVLIPLSADTRNIVGEKLLAAMKPTAYHDQHGARRRGGRARADQGA